MELAHLCQGHLSFSLQWLTSCADINKGIIKQGDPYMLINLIVNIYVAYILSEQLKSEEDNN